MLTASARAPPCATSVAGSASGSVAGPCADSLAGNTKPSCQMPARYFEPTATVPSK